VIDTLKDANPGFALATYPALLGSRFPIVVVGGVNTAGIYGRYSQGMAFELTVSASGSVICASRQGGVTQGEGTSFCECLSMQISFTFDDIGRGV